MFSAARTRREHIEKRMSQEAAKSSDTDRVLALRILNLGLTGGAALMACIFIVRLLCTRPPDR